MGRITAEKTRNHRNDLSILNKAFVDFNNATGILQKSYERLERRIQALNNELNRKNRELEKNLQEKEEMKNYLNNILESHTSGIIVLDLNGVVTLMNRAARRITGFTQNEAYGKKFHVVFGDCFESEILKSSTMDPFIQSFEVETGFSSRNAGIERLLVISEAFKSGSGEVLGAIIVMNDITREKRLEEQVERANRLAAMGEMAATISHEIRNPLGGIELYASMLMRDLKEDLEKQKLVEHIITGVKSMDYIISNLLAFTKVQEPLYCNIDIHHHIDESLLFARHVIKQKNIRLIKDYQYDGPDIEADTELLKQLFLNVILNAIQAMDGGGELIIGTTCSDYSEDSIDIIISDTGCGVESKELDRIFDPFFTTKPRGTGLGLAIVHKIVEAHNGIINVRNRKQRGTEFIITLPMRGSQSSNSGGMNE